MRTKDLSKKLRIKEAVFQLTREEGLAGVSISKIAKKAQVSTATAYVYYKDKTDMLSKIYIEVKQLMDEGLAEKMAINSTLKEKTFQSVQHFAQQFMAYPLEANFMWAIQANPEFVSSKAMEESLQFVAPLLKLQKELLDAKVLKEENLELVIPLLFSPITAFIDEKNRNRQPIAIRDLNRIITLSVDAVFIE